jgi:hypothetical protein
MFVREEDFGHYFFAVVEKDFNGGLVDDQFHFASGYI